MVTTHADVGDANLGDLRPTNLNAVTSVEVNNMDCF